MCVRAEPAQAHARDELLREIFFLVTLNDKPDVENQLGKHFVLLKINLACEIGENMHVEIQHERVPNPVHLVRDIRQERLSVILKVRGIRRIMRRESIYEFHRGGPKPCRTPSPTTSTN